MQERLKIAADHKSPADVHASPKMTWTTRSKGLDHVISLALVLAPVPLLTQLPQASQLQLLPLPAKSSTVRAGAAKEAEQCASSTAEKSGASQSGSSAATVVLPHEFQFLVNQKSVWSVCKAGILLLEVSDKLSNHGPISIINLTMYIYSRFSRCSKDPII